MDQIVTQMLHIAQYLEWEPTELRPVSFYKHSLLERTGHTWDAGAVVGCSLCGAHRPSSQQLLCGPAF